MKVYTFVQNHYLLPIIKIYLNLSISQPAHQALTFQWNFHYNHQYTSIQILHSQSSISVTYSRLQQTRNI